MSPHVPCAPFPVPPVIALIQRVTEATVMVEGATVGHIGRGIAALVGVERGDTPAHAERLLSRVLSYRVFQDAEGRMNLSLADREGGLLLVPNFTLAADTRKGTRASFTPAAPPDAAARLFAHLVERARGRHSPVAAGAFGAHMEVRLVNDGPVTFWLQT
jgi:D-tyrosyl-tRNA(Tyr) deacylase